MVTGSERRLCRRPRVLGEARRGPSRPSSMVERRLCRRNAVLGEARRGPMIGRRCDVLVVGGGPGGSTAAALLAQKDFSVLVVERESFPRFHIGESLLPANVPLLDRLGVHDALRKAGPLVKYGATFYDQDDDYYIVGVQNNPAPDNCSQSRTASTRCLNGSTSPMTSETPSKETEKH